MKKHEDKVIAKLELDVEVLHDAVANADYAALDVPVTLEGERLVNAAPPVGPPADRQKLDAARERLDRYRNDQDKQ